MPSSEHKLPANIRKRIVDRYCSGEESAATLGRIYGIDARTVHRYVKEAGKSYIRQAPPGYTRKGFNLVKKPG